jgi:redox-sensitive bicupin YhaK (pirin superfamily)
MQLFVNSAASRKQELPQALFIDSRDIPVVSRDGITVKIVTGHTEAASNPAETPDRLTFLDITIETGQSFRHELPTGWTATIYVMSGKAVFANDHKSWTITTGQVLAAGRSDRPETLLLTAVSDARIILLSGKPLGEPIFSAGAMAMGSQEELGKAISDFEEGRMGFIRIEGGVRTIVLAT